MHLNNKQVYKHIKTISLFKKTLKLSFFFLFKENYNQNFRNFILILTFKNYF